MVRFRDALSNVLFISVEQSLPVYPEDISLVALCTQRYSASQRAALKAKSAKSQNTPTVARVSTCTYHRLSAFFTKHANVTRTTFSRET